MKALILGGCADMAVPLHQLLKNDDTFDKIVLSDLIVEKAKKLAETLGPKFSAEKVDANEHNQVVGLMKGCDVVFCFIGPFYMFERKLASCAIEAKVNYISICDDYDAYLDVIQLDEKAKEAGVKILTGFGNSPGITQILARKGYNELKNPYKINISWCAGSDEKAGASNLMHLFHIFNGTTLQWFNGKEEKVKTGTGAKVVEFPEPVGKCRVYYTGHAESVSLPRNLLGLTEVTLHGGVKPEYIVSLVKFMSALKMFSTHKKRARLAKFFHRIESAFGAGGIDKSVGRIDIYGKDGGKTQNKYYTYVGHIAEITSIPAYTAAKQCLAGVFDQMPGGVYSAESLLVSPDNFIAELKKRGVEIYESEIMIE